MYFSNAGFVALIDLHQHFALVVHYRVQDQSAARGAYASCHGRLLRAFSIWAVDDFFDLAVNVKDGKVASYHVEVAQYRRNGRGNG